MKPDKVDQHLANYREYAARCDFLEKEIVELERWIDEMRSTFIEDNVHVTATMSDMPHGTEISNPAQKLAIMSIEGFTPDYIRNVQNEVLERKRQLVIKRPTIVFVNSWMMCLTPREKFVVKAQVLEGMFWRDIVAAFRKQYGQQYSRQGLKNIRDKAIEKIHKIAQ